MPRKWTEEQKQKQRELIRRWKPWQNATGPRTASGKALVAQNARKHGLRSAEMTALRRAMRRQREGLATHSSR